MVARFTHTIRMDWMLPGIAPTGKRVEVALRAKADWTRRRKAMSEEQTAGIARQLLAGMSERADPDQIAALFSVDVQFEIAGDVGAFPWIGRKTGRSAAADFLRETRRLVEHVRFDVQDILAGDNRAVILGELASRVHATGKIIETAFAIVLTVFGGEITRLQMLEDSFAVSRAARP